MVVDRWRAGIVMREYGTESNYWRALAQREEMYSEDDVAAGGSWLAGYSC